jgi:hypothetical protein
MPSDPNISVPGDENYTWLLQFYDTSKLSEMADSDASESLAELATVPAGKYRIGDEVGSGSVKSVLRACDRYTERNVAMAVLRDAVVSPKKISVSYAKPASPPLGLARLPQPDLLPRGGQGRSLCGVGTTTALRDRNAGGVPLTSRELCRLVSHNQPLKSTDKPRNHPGLT